MSAPSIDNDFLIEGRECECDGETSCGNHDSTLEVAYWFAYYSRPVDVMVITDNAWDDQPHRYERA